MPKISVIVPVFNVEKYLGRCIDSVLKQSYSDFELILVDDGSDDKSGLICDQYSASDQRIHVIHQTNMGLSSARNTAIDWVFRYSDSRWLTFLDSDDWLHPQMLKQMLDAAVQTGSAVSICKFVESDGSEPEPIAYLPQPRTISPEELYVQDVVTASIACAKLYRRDCFSEIRYPVEKIHEDEYVTHRILFRFLSVAVIDAPLYYYFVNPGGITKSAWTPKRFQGLDALKEQISYYRLHGFQRAQATCVRNYVNCALQQQEIIADSQLSEKEKRQYRRSINSSLARVIRENKSVFPVEKNYWIYELVFPHEMKMYWSLVALRKKITHRS